MGIVRILILFGVGYLVYRVLKGLMTLGPGRGVREADEGAQVDEMVQDPQCRTYVPLRDAYKKTIGGRKVYFCSRECAERYDVEKRDEGPP